MIQVLKSDTMKGSENTMGNSVIEMLRILQNKLKMYYQERLNFRLIVS